jgi:LysR family cys regulon transcriptional activator
MGMGVGIVASMAVGPNLSPGLQAKAAGHLFALNTTRVAVRRGAYLRAYTLDFILQLAPQLTRAEILAAV